MVPGTIGTPAARIRSRAAIFEPMASIASGGGPIQASPASLHEPREGGVLGEKAVAGMDRLRAGPARHLDDALRRQVRLGRAAGAEQVGLVGIRDVR